MKSEKCDGTETTKRKKSRLLPMALLVVLVAVSAILTAMSLHNRHDLNSVMEEQYGRWNPDKKQWESTPGEPHYVVCASKDINSEGGTYQMVAVCGELAEEKISHAASGYVDLYLFKNEVQGLAQVAELRGIESGSFGTPGSVTVVRLGNNLYGFKEDSGWTGQGYTNGYTTIYVPVGKTFHAALRFSSVADNTGVCDQTEEGCTARSTIERSIQFVPHKDSDFYVARITSSGYVEGKSVNEVYTLYYMPDKHEYRVPKDFKVDIGY